MVAKRKQIGVGSIGIQKIYDGTSSRVFVRYSANADGKGMTETPNSGTKFIGMYVTTKDSPSEKPSDYQWMEFKGIDGTSPISAFLTDELITIATDYIGANGNYDSSKS